MSDSVRGTTVSLSAVREYMQPADCEVDGCNHPNHPACPDIEPHQWSEWINPESAAHMGGWLTEPCDDPGERITVELPLARAMAFVRRWHGAIWDVAEGEWSTEDYRTGRESMDTLFIDGDPDAVAAVEKAAR